VFHEALIACCLTGTLILLFLGSWRSTLIVLVSIPLSILTSIVLLGWLGFTINVMTLGGLALAIGILVDDATVTVENIHRHMAMGKPLKRAILDGAHQIAIPALVATLCICIVFVSVVFLEGPARFLFVPFALAVVFAVFMSYILSRTLVPVLVQYLLRRESAALAAARDSKRSPSRSFFGRFHAGFTYAFERFRRVYTHGLQWALISRITVLGVFVLFVASAVVVLPFVGQDFFPTVDAGQLRLHVKAAPGTRIEETERLFAQVEDAIREIIPARDRELLIDNIGVPDPINLGFTDSSTVSAADGEILVSLSRDSNVGTLEYMKRLREELPNRFPGATFYFQPADIVNQILNFGVPAPIDVRIIGPNRRVTYPIAKEIEAKLARVPGAVDVHLHQIVNAPDLLVNVDRTRAAALNLTQRDIANNLLISLSSSGIVSPNYWSDPKTVAPPLLLAVQAPQRLVDSLQSLLNTPVLGGIAGPYTQLLANLATIQRREVQSVVTHTNIAPTYNVYANVQGRNLGSISGEINRIVAEARAKLPPGHKIVIEGQVSSMSAAFGTLGLGLIFAAVLVYLLMVVNFQSCLDPFIIIMALPGAFCGIVWMLYLTGTTFNVPSLMGSIMAVGVATANSILLVTFANEMLLQGRNSRESALAAGFTRLRPVLMTALAMIIGMIPMSLGLGEGGEQNAPLGRAVIGGLAVATITTLFVVPVIFSLLRRRPNLRLAETGDDQEQEARSSQTQPVY
jgi:multidrug efflux pump subunit AcrB